MLIHFQIRGERDWESLGSGISAGGAEPLTDALEDLRSFYDGVLPAGHYRYIEAQARDSRFVAFDLGADGSLSERRYSAEERANESASAASTDPLKISRSLASSNAGDPDRGSRPDPRPAGEARHRRQVPGQDRSIV
jgi:hypothetical protein